MVYSAAVTWIISFFLFLALLLVTGSERRRGRRFLLSSTRVWLDVRFAAVGSWLVSSWEHFVKYVVQLNWYYSIHSVLRMWLRVLVRFYTYFENIFERNRRRTKELRAEKRQVSSTSHLQQVADHKQDTALTPAQKKKLRQKKLDEKH